MVTIRKSLLQFIFSGTFMIRWNDKLRPTTLVEVDKQGHKMMVAWMLSMLSARDLPTQERLALETDIIEGGLFDYLYRLIITDIKPPVFYKIKDNTEHFAQLNEWVLTQLEPRLQPLGKEVWQRIVSRLRQTKRTGLAEDILTAAHLYTSWWEFGLIKDLGPWDEERQSIENSFRQGLAVLEHRPGVADLLEGTHTPLGRFANLCGQLRFQVRWSHTPRIPETSVLGHLFIVAAYAYFSSLAVGACAARRHNNFFAGLFHDLPEVLTRDIISPVKRSVATMDTFIREYEQEELESRVLGPLVQGGFQDIADRLSYFLGQETGSEFYESIRKNRKTHKTDWQTLHTRYNENSYDPKDGELLKMCDNLAAFVEAYTALRNGISSDQLQEALQRVKQTYKGTSLGNLHVGALLADFD